MDKSFLVEYKALESLFKSPMELAAAQANLVRDWLATKTKAMFDELRRSEPIFKSPKAIIVTRQPDVHEILSRDAEFTEAIYTPRMHRVHADFSLGMPDSPEYEREVSTLRLAAGRGDLVSIQQFVKSEAEKLVATAGHGSLDLVRDLARVVPARFAAWYLGVSGPDECTLQHWMRALFWDLFRNLSNDLKTVQAADAAATALKTHLSSAIAERKAAIANDKATPDDVMTRLLRLQSASPLALDDDGIRRNLTGLAVGAVETTSECVANVLDVLLDRPDMLAAAQLAANRDDTTLDGFVFEALRFKPQHPFLYRVCASACTIARGTPREAHIPAGSFIVAAVWSAMFDEAVVHNPESFRPGRPSGDYLLFGGGRHTCFGAHINRVQISAICRSVLRRKGLRRKAGQEGQMKYDGPFPDSLLLEFDT
ncbi:cytochrome P450 [Pseudomonas kilonensis]|uniref:cytochrome P450 n=1 Tax=Pseudomonas kilonensis TaxID=132476 RepID=UPI00069E90D7|nr:cytochrome P450 [Pseudomonas kilonensis]